MREFFVKRKATLKEKLIEICVKNYKEFMRSQIGTLAPEWEELVSDPVKH